MEQRHSRVIDATKDWAHIGGKLYTERYKNPNRATNAQSDAQRRTTIRDNRQGPEYHPVNSGHKKRTVWRAWTQRQESTTTAPT